MFWGRFVSTDSDQTETAPRKFTLGPLGSLNQVTKGLAKTIRAMADGTLDSQVGARICNGLGIMRACLETCLLISVEVFMSGIFSTWQPIYAERGIATFPVGEKLRNECARARCTRQTLVEASCVFRALMRYEVKQHDFKMFEGDS